LKPYDANVLVSNRDLANYFEKVIRVGHVSAKLVANWIMGELSAALNKDNLDITASPISAEQFAQLLQRIDDGTISGKIAKQVFSAMWTGEGGADSIIEQHGLRQITDDKAIEGIIEQVLLANSVQLAQYRSGKEKLFGFFVGQVMKACQGKANPEQVNKLLQAKLKADVTNDQ